MWKSNQRHQSRRLAGDRSLSKPLFDASLTPHRAIYFAILPLSRHFLAMTQSIKFEWLDPFRPQPEMEAHDYEASFSPRLPRRTALNRLNRLREAGLVERLGVARATVYRLTDQGKSRLETSGAKVLSRGARDAGSPLSAATEALLKKLRRPVAERSPAGYQRSFLDSYQPNQT